MAKVLAAKISRPIYWVDEQSQAYGKVFIDWSQNDEKKTTVCVYSLRAKEHPTVSTPVTWKEVEAGVRNKTKLVFETRDVLKRVIKLGDLFGPVLALKQKLPPVAGLRDCLEDI